MDNNKAFEEWFGNFYPGFHSSSLHDDMKKSFLAACDIKDKVIEKFCKYLDDSCPPIPQCISKTDDRECTKCWQIWGETEVNRKNMGEL